MMEPDYPAAHSMDSCWFAVDRDGHLGYFSTGEAGALPFSASMSDPYEFRDRLAAVLPRTEVIYDLKGRICPGPLGRDPKHRLRLDRDPRPDEWYLSFLKSVAPIQKELDSGQAIRVPGHGGHAVLLKGPTKALAKRLHEGDLCLGCFWHFEAEPDEPPPPAEFGLYEYGHLTENWISGPYGLRERPLQPAHIDQLPAEMRREIGYMSFHDFCFARRAHIQPVEYDQSPSWEPAYLTGDGKRIRENVEAIDDDFAPDEYAEAYTHFVEQSKDWLKGITIDPPRPEDDDDDDD
ncbi:MAG: hypothetical protein L0Z62_22205 [Gemmataceae bacterium]|nr:hypothetical protein [Gemmataceae bacterium]